jgi:hypothetical protein
MSEESLPQFTKTSIPMQTHPLRVEERIACVQSDKPGAHGRCAIVHKARDLGFLN